MVFRFFCRTSLLGYQKKLSLSTWKKNGWRHFSELHATENHFAKSFFYYPFLFPERAFSQKIRFFPKDSSYLLLPRAQLYDLNPNNCISIEKWFHFTGARWIIKVNYISFDNFPISQFSKVLKPLKNVSLISFSRLLPRHMNINPDRLRHFFCSADREKNKWKFEKKGFICRCHGYCCFNHWKNLQHYNALCFKIELPKRNTIQKKMHREIAEHKSWKVIVYFFSVFSGLCRFCRNPFIFGNSQHCIHEVSSNPLCHYKTIHYSFFRFNSISYFFLLSATGELNRNRQSYCRIQGSDTHTHKKKRDGRKEDRVENAVQGHRLFANCQNIRYTIAVQTNSGIQKQFSQCKKPFILLFHCLWMHFSSKSESLFPYVFLAKIGYD